MVAFFITWWYYASSDHLILFVNYVFIYSATPTGTATAAFSTLYDAKRKAHFNTAVVLSYILYVPFIFITGSLFFGSGDGSSGTAVSGVLLSLSLTGCVLLALTMAISTDWHSHPKRGMLQIGLVGSIFCAFGLACGGTATRQKHAFFDADFVLAAVSTHFRWWFRLLFSIVLPLDALLLHRSGKKAAARIWPYSSLAVAVLTAIFSGGWSGHWAADSSSGRTGLARFPCWYYAGDAQLIFDGILLFFEFVFAAGVFYVLTWTEPFVDEFATFHRSETGPSDLRTENSALEAKEEEERKGDRDTSTGSEGDAELPPSACGVTGQYMTRVKLMLAIHAAFLLLLGFSLSTIARSDLSNLPILQFIVILAESTAAARGLIASLVFLGMGKSSWPWYFAQLRRTWIRCLRGAAKHHGNDVVDITNPFLGTPGKTPRLWMQRLAHRIAVDGVIASSHSSSGKKCFRGKDVVNFVLREQLVRDRDEAVELVREMEDGGLVGHISHLYTFQDSNELYTFRELPRHLDGSSVADDSEFQYSDGRTLSQSLL